MADNLVADNLVVDELVADLIADPARNERLLALYGALVSAPPAPRPVRREPPMADEVENLPAAPPAGVPAAAAAVAAPAMAPGGGR